MDIQHHLEAGLEGSPDHGLDLIGESRLDRIRGFLRGVVGPADRDAHGRESRGLDAGEILLGDRPSPGRALRSLERIPHVQTSAETLLLLEDVSSG
jgi:hypothetical protein